MLFRTTGLLTALFFTAFLAGCEEEVPLPDSPVNEMGHEDHGGHGAGGHPETFAEAFTELTELRDTVKKAFDDEDSEAAHGPLHHVGHLLEEVSELGGDSDLTDDAKQIVETNVEKLLEAFGDVDKRMHDAEAGKDYSEVSEEIDAAIKAIADAAGELAEDDGHHDDHGEGEGHDADDDKHADHDEHGDGDHDEDAEHKDGDHDEHAEHKDGDHDEDADHKDGDHDEHAEHKDGDHDEHADADKDGHKADHKDGDHDKDAHGDQDEKHADGDQDAKPADAGESKNSDENDDKE